VIARCFAFVGHDLPKDAHFAIGNFISDALHKDFISVTGDGSQIRSYLNQKDLAIWLMILLEKGKEGLVYNVGSDESISILELAYLVRDTLSPGKSVIFQKEKNAHQGRNIYVPDITKAKHDLNLKVSISLQESLAEFL
jgi:UDP-glucuronate decarboxylase